MASIPSGPSSGATSITIKYVTEYGPTPNDYTYESGTIAYTDDALPVLTYEGYVHTGWYETSTFDTDTKAVSGTALPVEYGTITLYAKWEAIVPVLVYEHNLKAIADAIRYANSSTLTYMPSEMANAINELAIETCDITITTSQISINKVAYTALENGEIVAKTDYTSTSVYTDVYNTKFSNVIRGSIMVVYFDKLASINSSTGLINLDSGESLSMLRFHVTNDGNTSVTRAQ